MFYMQNKGHGKAAKVVNFVAKWLNLCLSTVIISYYLIRRANDTAGSTHLYFFATLALTGVKILASIPYTTFRLAMTSQSYVLSAPKMPKY